MNAIDTLYAVLANQWEGFDIPQRDGKAEEAIDRLARLVEAQRQCLAAMNEYVEMYPHMDKGFMVDARRNATEAIAALRGKETK